MIDEYYEICSMLTDTAVTLIDMRTLRKQVPKAGMVPSIEQQFRARVEVIVKDLEDLKVAVTYMKDAYDAKLRFTTLVSI